MKLEKLNPQDVSLTREQMLALKGGNINPTLVITRGVSNTEPDNVPDVDDAAND